MGDGHGGQIGVGEILRGQRRQALRAELDRCPGPSPEQEEAARKEVLHQLLERCRHLPWPDGRSSSDLQAELYDGAGLPR